MHHHHLDPDVSRSTHADRRRTGPAPRAAPWRSARAPAAEQRQYRGGPRFSRAATRPPPRLLPITLIVQIVDRTVPADPVRRRASACPAAQLPRPRRSRSRPPTPVHHLNLPRRFRCDTVARRPPASCSSPGDSNPADRLRGSSKRPCTDKRSVHRSRGIIAHFRASRHQRRTSTASGVERIRVTVSVRTDSFTVDTSTSGAFERQFVVHLGTSRERRTSSWRQQSMRTIATLITSAPVPCVTEFTDRWPDGVASAGRRAEFNGPPPAEQRRHVAGRARPARWCAGVKYLRRRERHQVYVDVRLSILAESRGSPEAERCRDPSRTRPSSRRLFVPSSSVACFLPRHPLRRFRGTTSMSSAARKRLAQRARRRRARGCAARPGNSRRTRSRRRARDERAADLAAELGQIRNRLQVRIQRRQPPGWPQPPG